MWSLWFGVNILFLIDCIVSKIFFRDVVLLGIGGTGNGLIMYRGGDSELELDKKKGIG